MTKEKQPGSSHCFVCGRENIHGLKMNFYTIAPGQVESFIQYPPSIRGIQALSMAGF